jgi:hypothetical protein
VILARVRRSGGTFYLDFESDAPALAGLPITFARTLADARYATEFADSGQAGSASLSTSLAGCEGPLWEGFLVTGDVAALAALLPADGTAAIGAAVEPALVQTLAGGLVTRIGLANDDRTRVGAAAGCTDPVYPFEPAALHVAARCLTGEVVFQAGYNGVVRQAAADNAVVIGAAVGAGAGEPCGDRAVFADEGPPAGSDLLTGGPRCDQVLRSVNGVGGPLFTVEAGPGVTVTPDFDGHAVLVSVDLGGLLVCGGMSTGSASLSDAA